MEQGDVLRSGQPLGGLTGPALRRRLSEILAAHEGALGTRGDHDLNPTLAPVDEGRLRHAAVLVPVVDRPDGPTLIFTQRTPHLAAHAGQISFPGGGLEACDDSEAACALRETAEEIGLAPERVEVLGRLDTHVTRTGFRVVPVVGLIMPPFELSPDPFEVAEVFEVPLGFFLDPASRQRHSRAFQGSERFFHAFPYGERYIWGVTAGILVNLCEVVGAP